MTSTQNFSDLVLISGCPRSGTNLLAMQLMKHFSLVIPFENHLIPHFWRWRILYGNLKHSKNRRRLLQDIYLFLTVRDRYVSTWMSPSDTFDGSHITPLSLLSTREASDNIAADATSYTDLVLGLFGAFARCHGAGAVGDKSAYYYPIPLETFHAVIPNIKIIHIVRDGRDVYTSWRKTWFGPANIAEAAMLWSKHVLSKRAWGQRHPDRYFEVKYEELLSNSEEVLKQLGAFLALDQVSHSYCYSQQLGHVLSTFREHSLLTHTIQSDNTGKWRKELSAFEVELFDFIANRALTEFGYPYMRHKSSRWNDIMLRLVSVAGFLQAPFSANWIRRHLQAFMPVFFYLGSRRFVNAVPKLYFRNTRIVDASAKSRTSDGGSR